MYFPSCFLPIHWVFSYIKFFEGEKVLLQLSTLYWPKAMSPMPTWQIIEIQASYLRRLTNISRALVGLASVYHFVLQLSSVLIHGNFPCFPMSSAMYWFGKIFIRFDPSFLHFWDCRGCMSKYVINHIAGDRSLDS